MEKNWIDKWLTPISQRNLKDLSKLIAVLKDCKEELGKDAFEIPYREFHSSGIKGNIQNWLKHLNRKQVITIWYENKSHGAMKFSVSTPYDEYGEENIGSGAKIELNSEKFEAVYLYLEHIKQLKMADIEPGNRGQERKEQGSLPECIVEKGIGYLKFGKSGAKKKIGNVNSRPFRFLQATIEPLGVYKSVDAVFSAIWTEKDTQDQALTNPAIAKARKVEIIKNSCIKELQKDNKLNGKIRFKFNTSKTQVKAVLVE